MVFGISSSAVLTVLLILALVYMFFRIRKLALALAVLQSQVTGTNDESILTPDILHQILNLKTQPNEEVKAYMSTIQDSDIRLTMGLILSFFLIIGYALWQRRIMSKFRHFPVSAGVQTVETVRIECQMDGVHDISAEL